MEVLFLLTRTPPELPERFRRRAMPAGTWLSVCSCEVGMRVLLHWRTGGLLAVAKRARASPGWGRQVNRQCIERVLGIIASVLCAVGTWAGGARGLRSAAGEPRARACIRGRRD